MLKDYLWEMYEVAMEENKDGDNFNASVGDAARVFVNCCHGKEQQYKCLDGFDKAAFVKKWDALTAEERSAEYTALDQFRMDHSAELNAAFLAGDRAAFEAIISQ